MRYAAGVEYCGAAYRGWQRQSGEPTVQARVEEALGRVADAPLTTHCAGRTDSGVHAAKQVVHFDGPKGRPDHAWVLGGNVHLPPDISLLWAMPVDESFHARYSATARIYRYVILNRRSRPGLLHPLVCWECRPLDAARMAASASALVGEHDFTSFRALSCQSKTAVRDVRRIDVERRGDFITIEIEANAFLHHMVRNIAGMLMDVGFGKLSPDHPREVLEARDRTLASATAPATGLYLLDVTYPDQFRIPAVRAAWWPCPDHLPS